jgi:uncharacterized damage-inducible protein DinB
MSHTDVLLHEKVLVGPLTGVLLREADVTYAVAEKLFRRVANEDLSWTPATGNNWMTVGQLLMHCASFGCGKAIQGFVKGDWGEPAGTSVEDTTGEVHMPPASALPEVESVERALSLLAEDRILALSCITAAREASLLSARCAAPWGGPELTLFEHLSLMIDHLAQHKGQLFYYLKLMGKKVDTGDLWGW